MRNVYMKSFQKEWKRIEAVGDAGSVGIPESSCRIGPSSNHPSDYCSHMDASPVRKAASGNQEIRAVRQTL